MWQKKNDSKTEAQRPPKVRSPIQLVEKDHELVLVGHKEIEARS